LWNVEHITDAGSGSYRGDLLGLVAVHLSLWGVNKVRPGLKGSVHILQKKCTKLLDTAELISIRHDCLSFAPRYSKGVSLKLWIFHE
jgi:hypothetical protein